MKKFGLILAILIGISVICVLSCPETQSHKESLIPMVTNVWNQQYSDKADIQIKELDNEFAEHSKKKPEKDPYGFHLNENGHKRMVEAQKDLIESFRSTSVGYDKVEEFLDNNFKVDNYFLFSIGKIRIDKEYENISLGLLGHIFTISEDEFRIIFDVIHT